VGIKEVVHVPLFDNKRRETRKAAASHAAQKNLLAFVLRFFRILFVRSSETRGYKWYQSPADHGGFKAAAEASGAGGEEGGRGRVQGCCLQVSIAPASSPNLLITDSPWSAAPWARTGGEGEGRA
jgi:hypothetical protein